MKTTIEEEKQLLSELDELLFKLEISDFVDDSPYVQSIISKIKPKIKDLKIVFNYYEDLNKQKN